jgi:hypothetical protein
VRVIQDWKAAHRPVRNFVPKTPPEYAEEVFDVYKEAVLNASYYFSISELLVDARLAGIPLITCVLMEIASNIVGRASLRRATRSGYSYA